MLFLVPPPLCTGIRCPRALKGFNLVEAAIVLGVVGLVIGGIWVAASSVSHTMKVNTLYKGIVSTVINTRTLFGRNMTLPNGSAAVSDEMWSAGVYPSDAFYQSGTGSLSIRHYMLDPANAIQTPYAVVYTQGPGQAYDFVLLLKFIDQGACIQILNKLAGTNLASSGIVKVQTSTVVVYNSSAGTPDLTITPAEADTACATPTDRNDFWIFFTK